MYIFQRVIEVANVARATLEDSSFGAHEDIPDAIIFLAQVRPLMVKVWLLRPFIPSPVARPSLLCCHLVIFICVAAVI